MPRDRVQNAIRRAHDSLHNTTIDVYEPTETYTQGEGWTVTYPDTPDATYDARFDSPSSNQDRDEAGTETEIDAIARVRDDVSQQWTGWGEATEAAVRIEEGGTTYEVQDVPPTKDGLTKLEVVAV